MLGSVLYLSANDGSAQCGGEVGRTIYTQYSRSSSFFPVLRTQGFFLFSEFNCAFLRTIYIDNILADAYV